MSDDAEITALLDEIRGGNRDAVEALVPLLYRQLRLIAAGYLRHERDGHTLEPTALVHEAYLRLLGHEEIAWQNRAHFLAVASQVMRRILTDHGRRRARAKRGGGGARVTLNESLVGAGKRDFDIVALDDALGALEQVDPELARVVEMRFFGGMTVDETAEALGLSPRGVDRAWATARAWLQRELRSDGG